MAVSVFYVDVVEGGHGVRCRIFAGALRSASPPAPNAAAGSVPMVPEERLDDRIVSCEEDYQSRL